jgi:hypothetical protein
MHKLITQLLSGLGLSQHLWDFSPTRHESQQLKQQGTNDWRREEMDSEQAPQNGKALRSHSNKVLEFQKNEILMHIVKADPIDKI